MRQRTLSTGRKHHVVLSLTPCSLELLHLQRGPLGWRRAHQDSLALPAGETSLQQVATHLQHCVTAWKIPAGSRIHWVLASDILGIISSAGASAPAAAVLPFAATETRTQPDQFAASDNPSLLWIHKDWLAEIERICEQSGLALMEVFARAQIFQLQAARFPGPAKVVLEAHGPETFLHIYTGQGMVMRSAVLDASDNAAMHARVISELAALGTTATDAGMPPVIIVTIGPVVASPTDWPGFSCHDQSPTPQADLLEQLWRSALEGIVVRPSHEDLTRQIQWMSVALGVAGLTLLGLMFWHDGRLQEEIDASLAQVRKERPKVEAAKMLKARTLQMADAAQAAQSVRENTGAMTGLALALSQFPPPPARLLYVRTDEKTLAFAGSGNDTSIQWLNEKGIPGYAPLTDLPVPGHLKDASPAIHMQTTRLPDPAAPASSSSAPPASSTK